VKRLTREFFVESDVDKSVSALGINQKCGCKNTDTMKDNRL